MRIVIRCKICLFIQVYTSGSWCSVGGIYKLTSTIGIEINSATDNPLIFPNPSNPGQNEVISQGNFHGEILALCADNMSHALFELGSISERRIDQMVDPQSDLPPFLAKNSGFESGMMIVHYVAAAALRKCMDVLILTRQHLHQVVKKTMCPWAPLLLGTWSNLVTICLKF